MGKLSGLTGELFESQMLSEEQRSRLRYKDRDFSRMLKDIPRLPYEEALKAAIGNTDLITDEESHDPPARWLNDLHAEIAERLNLDDYQSLRVIPSFGSAMDAYYKTDLIIVYEDPADSENPIIVTADLTLNPSGKDLQNTPVDLIITDKGPRVVAQYRGLIDEPEPVREIAYSTAKDERKREAQIKKNIAEMIAEIIDYKKQYKERGYRMEKTRDAVREVFTRGHQKS